MTGQRREQLVVGAAIAALWALLFVQAWQTPTLLDDWIQLGWYRGRGLGLELFSQVARYNHRYDNPRIGDLLLFLVNGPRAIHLVVTPIAELLLLWTALIAALGRRPRLCYGDLALALVLQVLIWLASPIPGVMYFYRPYTANYLFAFTVMLCWFAPYRLALARPPAPPAQPAQIERWWPVPMLVLGWLAGMSNEHTGPAAIGAVGVCLVYAWRHRRLRIWMIAGAIGLGAGYAMLMIAPGHGQRYAGRAARFDTLGLIASRGVSGNYDIVAGLLGEAGWAIALTAAAALAFVALHRRAGSAPPAMPRRGLLAVGGLVAAVGAMLAALSASPVTIERLLFAPAVLLAAALTAVAEHLFTLRRLRAAATAVCAVVFAYHAVRFVQIYAAASAENRQRIARLRGAAPGTVVRVPPYRTQRSRWYWGDDFRMAGIREFVAREVFELDGIELDPRPIWAEPAPQEQVTARAVYDPPLPPERAGQPPARYAPHYFDTALAQLRRGVVRGTWSTDEHRLVDYRIDAALPAFDDPAHRPIHVMTWTPGGVDFVFGDGEEDADGQPAIRVSGPPAGWTDAFVVGCGRTARIEPRRGAGGALILPVTLACRGSYTAIVCDPAACWFAGRYWR